MPRITANISTDEKVEEVRRLAFNQKKSIRKWAGEIIEAHLAEQRAKLKKGPSERSKKLPSK